MLTLLAFTLALLICGAISQPQTLSTPFTRLQSQIDGLNAPSAPATTPFTIASPAQATLTNPQLASLNPNPLTSSTLQYPSSLTNQLTIPSINMAGVQPSFTDPFAQQAAPITSSTNPGLVNGMLPAGLGNSINTLTSPFTTALSGPGTQQTSPISSTLNNLFGPATTSTTTQSAAASNPFGSIFTNAAPSQAAPATTTTTNSLFPMDSTLFPSAFSSNSAPAATTITNTNPFQTQAPSQLSTFSSPNAPNFASSNAGPQAPSAPFSQTPQGPAPPQAPSSFSPSAINGPSLPVSGDFSTQAAPSPILSNNSPFAPQSPNSPSQPQSPSGASFPNPPSSAQQPGFPSGPVLVETGANTKQLAPVVISRTAPLSSAFPPSPTLP